MRVQRQREALLQMEPLYREAFVAHKGKLLDVLAARIGYARRYAMWLLNHPSEGQIPPRRWRHPAYGPEVQYTLVFGWNATNRICSKRLMPFLPTLA